MTIQNPFVIHMAYDLRSSLCGLLVASFIFIHLFDLIKIILQLDCPVHF